MGCVSNSSSTNGTSSMKEGSREGSKDKSFKTRKESTTSNSKRQYVNSQNQVKCQPELRREETRGKGSRKFSTRKIKRRIEQEYIFAHGEMIANYNSKEAKLMETTLSNTLKNAIMFKK